MGLFDRKKDEEEDLVIVQPPRPVPPPVPAASPEPPRRAATPEYGIANVIELMRRLPAENPELVVAVVKSTLESMKVDVSSIIEDARGKETRIQGRIATLEQEIKRFEEEITTRKREIEALRADFAETSRVKDRLEQATRGKSEGRKLPPPSDGPNKPEPGAQA